MGRGQVLVMKRQTLVIRPPLKVVITEEVKTVTQEAR